jgi:DNA polymerase-3 subunit epsilon
MILCGIDIETSGLEMETDHITEVAWSIKRHGEYRSWVDKRYYIKGATEIPDKVRKLTLIHPKHCEYLGRDMNEVASELLLDIGLCEVEAMVAHNAVFDRGWLEHKAPVLKDCLPWIDTLHDINWGITDVKSRHLPYLCVEQGFLNPFPHNAVADVWAMLRVLDGFDIKEVWERSKSPMITVRAHVDYDDRQKAKDQRFRWEKMNDRHYSKKWIKVIKECDFPMEEENCDFNIEVIDKW